MSLIKIFGFARTRKMEGIAKKNRNPCCGGLLDTCCAITKVLRAWHLVVISWLTSLQVCRGTKGNNRLASCALNWCPCGHS